MVGVTKSQPAPVCLEVEKHKVNGDYKCGDVLRRTVVDFRNKCYICEYKNPQSINVEHFIPHRGGSDLKFAWNNLFWACSHCNNEKSRNEPELLKCTDPNDRVDEWIHYQISPFPKERANIESRSIADIRIESTVAFLQNIYNGSTLLKKMESANIRAVLLDEIRAFQRDLEEFYSVGITHDARENAREQIQRRLHPESAFTAFKKWIIRDNEAFLHEFAQYLDQ